MNTKMLAVVLVLIVVLGAGVYFFSKNKTIQSTTQTDETQSQDVTPTIAEDASPSGAMDAGTVKSAVKEFTVNGSNFKFSPAVLSVNKGDTVKIIFKNTGGTHDFVIDEFDAAIQQIEGGETGTVQFVADKTGTFEYYCAIGNHRQQGMKGILTVQ